MKRTSFLVPVLFVALTACGSDPSTTTAGTSEPAPGTVAPAAITGGTPTTGDLGVAALMRGGTLACTATLVSPRVLLTAAHCVPDGPPPDAFFGATPSSGGVRVPIAAVKRHPSFDATALTDDVAMAVLASPAPAGATPWPLPTSPADAPVAGTSLRLVGFGLTGPTDGAAPAKRVGTASVGSLGARELDFAPSPSQTCGGDSGGPAFATFGGVEAIVGVTSSGDPACAQMARDMRVDAYASFIAPWLAASAEGAAGPGDRCYYAANCAASAGACAEALDDPTLSFCAPDCGAGDACPTGLACFAGGDGSKRCRHAAPSPGAAGAPCAADGDCAAARCAAPASGGLRVCAVTCFPDLPGFCAAGFTCAEVAGAASASACFAPAPAPASSSGCSVTARRADGASLAALALASAVLARLTRRRRSSAPRRTLARARAPSSTRRARAAGSSPSTST